METKLKLYEISADNGHSWTDQWLTWNDVLHLVDNSYLVRYPNNPYVIDVKNIYTIQ